MVAEIAEFTFEADTSASSFAAVAATGHERPSRRHRMRLSRSCRSERTETNELPSRPLTVHFGLVSCFLVENKSQQTRFIGFYGK
jgi:hypothetical protein